MSPWSLFLSCLYVLEFFLKGGTGRGRHAALGGESGDRPLFLGLPGDPLAHMGLSTTALGPGDSWPADGAPCSHPGPPFPALPGAGLLWARDLPLQSTCS